MKIGRRVWLFFQIIGISVVIVALAATIWRNREQLIAFSWHLQSGLLLISFLIWSTGVIMWSWIWERILVGMGETIDGRTGMRIYIETILAKYIPGSVWNYVGRAVLARQSGLSQSRVWCASIYEFALAISVGLTISLWYFASPASDEIFPLSLKIISLCLWIMSFLFLSPPIFNWLMRRIATWKKHSNFDLHLTFWKSLLFWGATLITWVIIGLAFSFFVSSIGNVGVSDFPALVVTWSIATSVSMIAIMFPQGFGLKEGVLAVLLSAFLPIGIATVIAITSRIWTIVCDICLVIILGFIRKVMQKKGDLYIITRLTRKKY